MQFRSRAEFRSALADADALRVRKMWATEFPHLPQPETAEEAEVCMHAARTAAESLPLAKRLYSHAWLDERGLPSRLPDKLRPPAQQVVPRVVRAVGIAVVSTSMDADRVARAMAIERVMGDAAAEMHGCGITDPERVSARMWQARDDFIRNRIKRWL